MSESVATTAGKRAHVRAVFERPEWYLDTWRYNIILRSETINEFLGQSKFQSILDIGCGDGSLSVELLTSENHLTLLDLSTRMLSVAYDRVPEQLRPRVFTINQDFIDAPLSPESFDLILCVGVLAHVDSPEAVLDRIMKLLRPGGSIILEFTAGDHFLTRVTKIYDSVLSLFGRAKYRVNNITSDFVLSWQTANNLKLRGIYRYTHSLPGIHKFLSQKYQYKLVRSIFGAYPLTRNSWLGSEHIVHLESVS